LGAASLGWFDAFADDEGFLGRSRASVPLMHISTDFVLNGQKFGSYTESDPIAPINVYGRTKAKGEEGVRNACANHPILRTAWLFSSHGSNFLTTVLRLAAERDEFDIVPTSAARRQRPPTWRERFSSPRPQLSAARRRGARIISPASARHRATAIVAAPGAVHRTYPEGQRHELGCAQPAGGPPGQYGARFVEVRRCLRLPRRRLGDSTGKGRQGNLRGRSVGVMLYTMSRGGAVL
jgi:hypothetical protein